MNRSWVLYSSRQKDDLQKEVVVDDQEEKKELNIFEAAKHVDDNSGGLDVAMLLWV